MDINYPYYFATVVLAPGIALTLFWKKPANNSSSEVKRHGFVGRPIITASPYQVEFIYAFMHTPDCHKQLKIEKNNI
ncbi:hypothetical protein GCM10020331_000970 [Ectobacillus funiculus]